MSETRVAIVFPPPIHPTGPPLGPACLKAFLGRNNPTADVKVFDLNLAHYRQAIRWMQDGRLKMSLRKTDHDSTARGVARAFRFFEGQEGLDTFLDIRAYDEAASFYRSFETVLNGLFENFCRKFAAGLPVPPLARAYLLELIEPVRAFRPHLAGFSLLFSRQLFFSAALAKIMKEDGSRVVFGGATLSVMPRPESLLSGSPAAGDSAKTSERFNFSRFVDYLLIGEGEAGLSALVRRFDGGESEVPGLVYLRRGRIFSNPVSAALDIHELPLPDFSDFPLADYHSPVPVLPYLSSRGCFWGRCAFCTHQKTYLAYREEAVDRTIRRLAELKTEYGASHFSLVDEMIHAHRFKNLSARILGQGLDISYSAYAKPTNRFDGALFRTIHRSGARVIMWGVESGSQRLLDSMRKGTRVDVMKQVLEAAHKVGIWNLVFVMFGFPTETREEWQKTLDLLDGLGESVDALSKSRFLLLEGSDILKDPARFGITRVMNRPNRDPVSIAYDYEVSEGLSQEEAQQLFEERASALSRHGRSHFFPLYRDHMLIHASTHRP